MRPVRTFYFIFIALFFLGACSGGIRVPADVSAVVLPALPIFPISPSNNNTPAISFTLTEAGQVSIYSDSLCTVPLSTQETLNTGENSIALNGLSEGAYDFFLQHTPSSGNPSTCTLIESQYVIDMTPPSVLLTSSASSVTRSSIQITATFSEAVDSFVAEDVQVSNGTVGSFSGNGASYMFTVTPTTEGAVTISVEASAAQDPAGNTNTASNTLPYTYDITAPTSPSLIINSGASYTNTSVVALSLSATDSPFEMYVTNTAGCGSGGAWESYSTSKTDWTLSQSNATATVYAKFRDAIGNEGSCVSDTIIHDNIAPTSPTISINSDAVTTSSTSVTIALSANKASQMYVTDTTGCASGGTIEAYATTRAWTLSSGDGTKTVYIKYLDEAGNTSSCISDSITLDTTPPNPSAFTATANNAAQLSLSWTSGGGTTDKFQVAYQTGSTAPADCETGTVISYS
ncbi:MAG: hypothetical protein EBU08_17445, partial [Micrococcales bacterium]|nr:hypothetical protein [Micrococcales bacterium]